MFLQVSFCEGNSWQLDSICMLGFQQYESYGNLGTANTCLEKTSPIVVCGIFVVYKSFFPILSQMRHWYRLKLTTWTEKAMKAILGTDANECNLITPREHSLFLILWKSLSVACNSDLDYSALCLVCPHDSHQAFCCSYSSIHKAIIDYTYRMRCMLPVLLLRISLQCSFTAESALKQLLKLYFSSKAIIKRIA